VNKKQIYFLIVLTSIAFVGLILIQGYWIKNAITVKEAQFRSSVARSASEVIDNLHQIEREKALERYQQGEQLYRRIDSINYQIRYYVQQHPDMLDQQGRLIDPQINRIINSPDGVRGLQDESLAEKTDSSFLKLILLREETVNSLMESSFRLNASPWLNINSFQPIEERIQASLIDSLIRQSLDNYGVTTTFEYGIFDPGRNFLVQQKSGQFPKELLESPFRFRLFPGEMSFNPSFLLLYFPNEKRFLLTQLKSLLSISGLLMAIIVLSFVFTTHIIFRQKKLSEMKNDLINNMTHEFKTPISTISLACEALSDKDIAKSEELYQSYIQIIREENSRLKNMAEKVLTTALLEKGKLQLRLESFDVEQIIKEAIASAQLKVEAKNGKILTDFYATETMIVGDKLHLLNVVSNLLDNSIKYSGDGVQIIVTTENTEQGISFSVKDNGIGISHADQKRIFEKLYRVSNGDIHNVKGFGLGLSYVKAIVALHGGTIKLDSELKSGTKFSVYLPFQNKTIGNE